MKSFWYFWKEGFRNIFSHSFMSLAAITIMVASLIMTGTVALLSYNIDLNIVKLQQDNEIVAFIDESLSTREAQALESDFRAIENVNEVTFESRDEALESYRIQLEDDASILDSFNSDNNPLRNGFHMTLVDPNLASETIEQIKAVDGVANIRADVQTIDKLISVQNVFNIISLAMIVALAVISIFIIANTVKLGMFARREEIAIQKMVGATNWFIRWPFVVEGMVLGLVAGGLAYLAEWCAYRELEGVVTGVIPSLALVPFVDVWQIVLGVFMGASLLFGICGTVLTIRKFMDV